MIMRIKDLIKRHQVKFRHAFGYILRSFPESITLNDQEKACGQSWSALRFAQLNIPGTDITKCQEHACKNSKYAFYFAQTVPGADISYCQKYSCKKSNWAYYFARYIPGADIEYCRKACESDKYWLNRLNQMIAEKNANIKYNRKSPG